MKPAVPHLMSFNGGYVDTAGFLALHGLFTSHVTGNFVTFGASLAFGTTGALAKLLALPVFCIVVMLVRILGRQLPKLGANRLGTLLVLKALLLAAGGALAILWGPFPDGDAWRAIVTGMILVAAMALQNAVNRVHFANLPPTTIMTGTSTQIMLDVADLITGELSPEERQAAVARARALGSAIGVFALGCIIAAGIFAFWGMSAFILPPLIAFVSAVATLMSKDTAPA
jgi:uncharacterized membrane protein YoaK (UPF0700 family)